MREEIWTEKIFKDDAGYFLRITKNHKCAGVSFPMWRKIARLHQRVFFANTRKENEGTCCRVKNLHFVSDKPPRSFHLNEVIYISYYKGKKKLCKLYTNPTFNSASFWFPARYEMYSLQRKPYTNHTLNYTLRRFKPYTKTIHKSLHRHTNPTQNYTQNPTLQRHAVLLRSAPRKN